MKTQPVLKNPVARRAWAAMQEAVADVVEEHRRHGRPLAIWREGKVAWVQPQQVAAVRERPPAYKTRRHGKKS